MADKSKIEWTDATWNPVTGCSILSPGCINCYAMDLAATRLRNHPSRQGLTKDTKAGQVWTGEVRFNEGCLTQPLHWKKPRMVFVCAHGDLFHEDVPDAWIDKVFAVMALAPQHTFQVLTKRAKRMREYLSNQDRPLRRIHHYAAASDNAPEEWGWCRNAAMAATPYNLYLQVPWPLPNVWLGVSAERQQEADERTPELLATPAAVRFVSIEPLLGAVDLRRWMFDWGCERCGYGGHQTKDHCPNCGWVGDGPTIEVLDGDAPGDCPECSQGLSDYYACPECMATSDEGFGPTLSGYRLGYIDWVIVGGESGDKARSMHPDWARSLRDQCAAADVPFFFKQWGEHAPAVFVRRGNDGEVWRSSPDGKEFWFFDEMNAVEPEPVRFRRIGKKKAGRLLDGVEHNALPTITRETSNGV